MLTLYFAFNITKYFLILGRNWNIVEAGNIHMILRRRKGYMSSSWVKTQNTSYGQSLSSDQEHIL